MIGTIHAIGAAILALQSPAPIQTGPLTIDQAVAIAQRNAFAARIQASVVEQNRQRVTEARGNMGPRLGFTGVLTRYDQQQQIQLDPSQPPIVIQPISSTVGTLGLQVPLDISGNLGRQVRAAEANFRASQQNLRASLNDTRLNARQAFLAVLRAAAVVGVQDQAVRDAQERLNQGRLLLAGEQVARVDVTRLEAAVAQATSDLLSARNNLQIAKNQFNLVLARPIETPVDLIDIPDLPAIPADADTLVTSGQANRPEVLSLRETLTALANITRATEASLSPTLNAGVNLQRNLNASGFSPRDQTVTGTLTLSVPIFDSGITRARVKQARQNEEQARINLEQTELVISQDVRNALQNVSSALARLNNAQQQVRLAEEVYRLAVVRQQAAEGTYVEVVDAETALTQARNGLVSARYDYLQSYSQLQRAVGADNLAAAATGTAPGAGTGAGTPSPSGGGGR